ncbi:MAG TPA: hypothetical protein VGJ41_13390 [Nocardioides sp.]|jgi:hypothetical protein
MVGGDSTLYTIGTALHRARDLGLTVQVLVAGHWLEGAVTAVDGHGVVLTAGVVEQSVIRLEMVSAVRMVALAHPAAVGVPAAAEAG